MKNKAKRGISIALSSAMIVVGLGGCSFTGIGQTTEEYKEEIITQALTDTVKPSVPSGKDNVKEETVYVFTDSLGAKKNILVNEKLNNSEGSEMISDETTLSNIVNLSGDEAFTFTDDTKLDWAADGNTVTYQGTTAKNPPIEITATYYLEGNEVSPEEIAGKSGNIKIRFDYKNNESRLVDINGEKKGMYVPFTVVTGMLLSGDNFSNIEVTNGKTTQIGNDTLVAGVAMPGLKESLAGSLENMDISLELPESVEISAYATNFEIDTIISVATANIAADIDTDKVDTEGIEDKIDELKDATDKLADGSKALQEGTQKLADSVPDLVSGVGDLNEAAGQLKEGAGKIKDGVSAYTGGVGSAAEGAAKIDAGAGTLNGAVTSLVGSFKDKLVPSTQALTDGANKLSAGVNQLLPAISASLDAGKDGAVATANAGLAAEDALTALNGGTPVTMENIDGVIAALEEKRTLAEEKMFTSDADALTYVVASQVLASQGLDINTQEGQAALQMPEVRTAVYIAINGDGGENPGMDDATKQAAINGFKQTLIDNLNTINATIDSLNNVKAQVAGAQGALEQVKTGLANNQQAAELVKGASDLADGMNLLNAGIGSFDEAEMKAVMDAGQNNVCTALTQIQGGTASLKSGTGDLSGGLNTLKGKSGELNNGVASLADGTVKLAEGTGKLNEAAGTLGDGVGELNAGAITLKDGMIKFNNEGISKLSDLFDSDSDNLINEVKAVLNLGKEYKSFAGKSDDIDGSVIFIYKMDGIR